MKGSSVSGAKILVVDDHPEMVAYLVQFFAKNFPGIQLFQTIISQQALEIARKEKPDVIFTDWQMPQLSGLDLLDQLQAEEETRDIAVIICSGNKIASADLKLALQKGAVDYIRKPFDPVELMARVESALKLKKAQDKIKQQNLELEQQKCLIEQEKERNVALLEQTIQLQKMDIEELAIQLSQNRTMSEQLVKQLGQLKHLYPAKSKPLKNMVQDLENQIYVEQRLKSLQANLDVVNTRFYDQLRKKYPSLTTNEIALCAYYRIGLSNKEIAILKAVSPDAIKKARQRLKKKIGLDVSTDLSLHLKLDF